MRSSKAYGWNPTRNQTFRSPLHSWGGGVTIECKRPDDDSGVSQSEAYFVNEPYAKLGIFANNADPSARCVFLYRNNDGGVFRKTRLVADFPRPGEKIGPNAKSLTYNDLKTPPEDVVRKVFRNILDTVVVGDSNVTRNENQLDQICNLLLLKLDSDKQGRLKVSDDKSPFLHQCSGSHRRQMASKTNTFPKTEKVFVYCRKRKLILYTISCMISLMNYKGGDLMLIALSDYAKIHDRSNDTVRRLAENGALKTAKKIGRNWVVNSEEEYPFRKKTGIKKNSVISLFAGCGGMDLGFVGGFDFLGKHYGKTGFDIIWANEINPVACETYRRNIGNHIIEGDIGETIQQLPDYADVVIGGFPCQDISINGKMLGIDGKRSGLYTYIVEAVKKTNPKVFVAENVGGLLLKQNEYSLNAILSDFNSLNYNISYKLYNAVDYGVPQTRERVVFVGTRRDMPIFTPPTPVCDKNEYVTAKEAMHDLETREADTDFSHIWSKANVSGEQGNRRLIANRPGYTMRAECHGNIHFHYCLPRRISMREAARIQSFPDTFIFNCGLRETERQIGNAVPPVLAWHIACAIQSILK